jgi:hypothetical protein
MDEIYWEKEGVVSLWAGQVRVADGSNFLRDQYGVEYYDPDNQECVVEESIIPISDLIPQLSYSESFRAAAIESARRVGISSALWVMAQYDFAYDPSKVALTLLPQEPAFLGSFPWRE